MDGGIQAELGKIAPLCPSRVRPFKRLMGRVRGSWRGKALGADSTACADGARSWMEGVVDEGSVVHGSISYDLSGPIMNEPIPSLPNSVPDTRSYM